jgi:TRAP-type mannitol/chloroaromatic compound transport system permease small subunit
MMVAAYTHLYNGHVSVDLFYTRLSRRWQAIIDVLSYLIFFFPFFLIFVIAGSEYAAASWKTGETTLTARLPLVMPAMKTLIPLASLLLLLQGLSHFTRSLFFVVRGREI